MYNGLPEACLTLMPSDGRLIYIERGQSGYHTSNWDTGDPAQNRRIADNYNQRQGGHAGAGGGNAERQLVWLGRSGS